MLNLVELIKKAAVDAVKESKPASILFGTVTSADPLKIMVDQKLTLEADHLILTNAVRDHEVEMTVDHFTEEDAFLQTTHTHASSVTVSPASFDSTHKHAYKGRKKFLIHNGLQTGEQVILVQIQGGQQFVVLDRLVIE